MMSQYPSYCPYPHRLPSGTDLKSPRSVALQIKTGLRNQEAAVDPVMPAKSLPHFRRPPQPPATQRSAVREWPRSRDMSRAVTGERRQANRALPVLAQPMPSVCLLSPAVSLPTGQLAESLPQNPQTSIPALPDLPVLSYSDPLASGPAQLGQSISGARRREEIGVGFRVVSDLPSVAPRIRLVCTNSGSAPGALDRAHLNPAP